MAISLGILLASGQLQAEPLQHTLLLGELSLEGVLRPLNGVLPMVMEAKARGFTSVVLPASNAEEAALVDGLDVLPVETLQQAVAFLQGETHLEPYVRTPVDHDDRRVSEDFSDVRGRHHVKRALEVAAAGMHNILLIGPPGSGENDAGEAHSIYIPNLSAKEALEVTKIYSTAGLLARTGQTGVVTSLLASRISAPGPASPGSRRR